MRELLSDTGSIYVHCDWHVNFGIRALLNDIFSFNNFRNEIVWKRTSAHGDATQGARQLGRLHDTIFHYTKSDKYTWNVLYQPYDEEYVNTNYRMIEKETGRRFQAVDLTARKPGGDTSYEWKGYKLQSGRYWAYSKENMAKFERDGRLYYTSSGLPRVKYYLDEMPGVPLQDLWTDVKIPSSQSHERVGYETQKPEALLKRIIEASSNEGDLVADFFCGSGTTGAVAEKLGRRWIMADLGRFAIHTSRKRMIGIQRELYEEDKPYRAFDVYNLGRYERQWWQKERLKGADEEHRRVVLEFYRAEVLQSPPSPLIHGRKGSALCHVDSIDGLFTREELRAVAKAAKEAGAKELHCLAWEFEMDLRLLCHEIEHADNIKIKLIPIPREIMEKNRTSPPPFLEVAVLEAEVVYNSPNPSLQKRGIEKKVVDIKLKKFLPSLAEVPSKELEALKERAIKSGFDFIDFWAVDFDYQDGQPFEHHWQAYRTRKDRSLPTVSNHEYDKYPNKGKYTACVKVVDIFGCDTSITVEVEI